MSGCPTTCGGLTAVVLYGAQAHVWSVIRININIVSHQQGDEMRFCTAINCMDGRVQLPVIIYLQKRFGAEYVDSITQAGPNLILAERKSPALVESILERLEISIENHNSVGVAIVGHHDCAGNPALQDDQVMHIQKAMQFLRQQYENMEIIGLWVDKDWEVHEVTEDRSGG